MKSAFLKILFILFQFSAFAQLDADFNVDKTVGCAPLVVNFMDISNGGNTWQWDFGNGVSSNQQNPTYVFSQPGFYTVKLTISDGTGSDTETKSALIRVNPSPIANFSVNNQNGCSPHTARFNDQSVPQSGAISTWFWAFGNGETSSAQNPTVIYNDIKNYDVFLKVTDINGCESTISKSNYIKLDGPKAKFAYDSVVCGLPADVTFLNQSSGSDLNYFWDFGDGSTTTGDVPGTHQYTSFDSTEVTLIVTEKNTGCADTLTSNLVVGNYEAKFDWDIECGDDEFTINVENTTDVFTTLEWDFGGQTTKFTPTASHFFNTVGPHEITLRATVDPSCWDTTTITYNLPRPNFTYTAPICSDPFEVTFDNISSGTELDYYWDFGDSTFSTDKNPIHVYDVPPERYRVELFATDQFSCIDSISRNVVVPFPIARFYEIDSIYTGCAPLNLTFRDTSYTLDSDITSVKWDFGDPPSGAANTSTDTMPTHNYAVPGDYDITYIIFTDDGCSDTVVYESFIRAGEKPLTADFTQSPSDNICYGSAIDFNLSANYASSFLESNYYCWAFYEENNPLLVDAETLPPDCPKSEAKNNSNNPYVYYNTPKHTYNEFNTVLNQIGDTISTGTVQPNAGQLYTHLFVGYNNCITEVINPTFVDTTVAVNGYVSADDFNFYIDSNKTMGFYQASLNYDSIAYSYVYSAAHRDTLLYIPENDTLYYELEENKNYKIRTKVVNSVSGCENEIIDNIIVDSIRLGFDMPERQCLNDNPVLMIDTSYARYGRLIGRNWVINDTETINSSREDSIYYTFPDTGVYKITIQNTYQDDYTQYGKRTFKTRVKTLTKFIKIEGVIAKGFSDTLTICAGETIAFTDTSKSTTLIDSYKWRFGDGSDSLITKSANHLYDKRGDYKPSLVVTDTFGCYDSIVLPTIDVNSPLVDFEVADTLICKGDAVAIKNQSIGESLSFTWTADGLIQSNIDIVQQFDSVGFFDVKLHAVDKFGCEDSLTKINELEVAPIPDAKFFGDPITIDCPPLTSLFSDTTESSVTKWNWTFGDGNTGNSENPTHIFTTPGLYDVSLTVTNYGGCKDTLVKADYVDVKGPNGTLEFNKDTVCLPDDVIFDLDLTNTQFYVLNYGDGNIVSYNYNDNPDTTMHAYQNGGLFQPAIELLDANGCFYSLPQLPTIIADSINARFKTSGSIICDVNNIPFTNTSRQSLTNNYTWSFGDGAKSTTKSPVHSYTIDSTYTVKLLQESPIGCTDSTSQTIKVYNAPYPDITLVNNNFCIPSETVLKLDFGNNFFESDSTSLVINDTAVFKTDSIDYTFSKAGVNKVAYFIYYGQGNCVTDSTFDTNFYEYPIAQFDFTPKNNSLDEPVIFFQNQSQNATLANWDFNDMESSTTFNPGHSYETAGSYNVKLIAGNDGGCWDTISQIVPVAPYDFVKLPSGFSPNGDGQNDYFGVLRAGDFNLEIFKIFNRWGNVVYESTDINEKWDGERNDKPQNTGTYVYYLKGTRKDGTVAEIKGNFTLVR